MVEFVIIWPLLAMLVLGTLQIALVYLAKTTLNYAVFEAAREGALGQAKRDAVERGFARGMAPLYTTKPDLGRPTVSSIRRVFGGGDPMETPMPQRNVQDARAIILNEISNDFVCIERINPTNVAFATFALGTGEIPNDNLMYRGLDESSGTSIQDANLLKLRITYCYHLVVPLVDKLIVALLSGRAAAQDMLRVAGHASDPIRRVIGRTSFIDNCLNNERIPIVAQSIVRMQSPATNDRTFDTSCD